LNTDICLSSFSREKKKQKELPFGSSFLTLLCFDEKNFFYFF